MHSCVEHRTVSPRSCFKIFRGTSLGFSSQGTIYIHQVANHRFFKRFPYSKEFFKGAASAIGFPTRGRLMPSGLIQSEQLLAKRAAVGRDLAFSYLGFFDVFLAIGCWWCSSIMFKRNRSHVCSFKRLYESKDLQIGARRHVHIGTLTASVLGPRFPRKIRSRFHRTFLPTTNIPSLQ